MSPFSLYFLWSWS